MPLISTLNESYPTDCKALLQVRKEYADYRYYLNRGYIAYQVHSPSRYYEHRLVAELVYGSIPDGYHVHHINENPTDNRASNLQLLDPGNHARQHKLPTGQVMICPICGESFWRKLCDIKRRNACYCSQECLKISQRVAVRPNRDELQRILTGLPNFAAIGRMYGVDGNAIRKWCRGYELPTAIDYWKDKGD
jgi:hypothetical protein